MKSHTKNIGIWACCVAIPLTLGGCEEDVASPSGVEEPFSMYGIINPRLARQTLLVSPIEDLLYPLDSSIDAIVTSHDLTSGQRYFWYDSVAANETGQLDHVFWADFRPEFGSKHVIDAQRSDGSTSSVEVNVPPQVIIEDFDDGTRKMTVAVLGHDFRLIRVDAVYEVRFYTTGGNPCDFPTARYSFSHTGSEITKNAGYELQIDLNYNYERMRSFYYDDFHDSHSVVFRNPLRDGLALMHLELSITVGEEAWSPAGGQFDRHLLVHPGTLSNVRNGMGFVGGGYNQDKELFPSTRALDDTWFFDFIMRGPGCDDFCSCGQE